MRIEHPLRSAFDLLVRKSPVEAQLVVIRRCNLSCGYCSEYDSHSPEIPFDVLATRIDAIHRLRAVNIALLGGEPLLHSRIHDLVRYASRRAQVSMTTNGFLLDRKVIDGLGDAGLANLQISIDALRSDPNRYIQKTFKSLKPKLDRLAEYARFDVHVTVVLCPETVDDFDELTSELSRYPFRVSVNIMHDSTGQVMISGPEFEGAWRRHFEQGRPFSFLEEDYGRKLLRGERPSWTCQAGARFLYVGEDGTVELCSGQRGRVGKNITEYTSLDLEAHYNKKKGCEEGCSVLCVYRDSLLDNDPATLGRALFRGFSSGVFGSSAPPNQEGPKKPPSAPRRHLPLMAQ
jgi:MoaA/NifB/PqqE/SkfB family radical SAM enzyme